MRGGHDGNSNDRSTVIGKVSQIENVDTRVNVDVESHPVECSTPTLGTFCI